MAAVTIATLLNRTVRYAVGMNDETALRKLAEKKRAEEHRAWEDEMGKLTKVHWPALVSGVVGDIEPQPVRWLRAGLDELDGGSGSHPSIKTLTQVSFQFGAELFLKGMWLCRYDDCRQTPAKHYVPLLRRKELTAEMKSLGHDVFKMVDRLEQCSEYSSDPQSLRFLSVVRGIAGRYYYPLFGNADWASYRYPTRFYNDQKSEAVANLVTSFPHQWAVRRSFAMQSHHLDTRWRLTETLMAMEKAQTKP